MDSYHEDDMNDDDNAEDDEDNTESNDVVDEFSGELVSIVASVVRL